MWFHVRVQQFLERRRAVHVEATIDTLRYLFNRSGLLLAVRKRHCALNFFITLTDFISLRYPTMSPLQRTVRFAIRADTDDTPANNSDGGATPTVHIKQDTVAPLSPPTATGAASTTIVSAASASASSAPPAIRDLSGGTKIGLAMIPIVVMLVGLYILFLFWFRKRRAARKTIRGSISPPVPEKDLPSYNSSIASRRRSSKVFHMSAFSTPIPDGRNREAQFLGDRAAQQERNTSARNGKTRTQVVAAPLRSPHMEEADSPIDATSPFRLKRGDTVKRCSIGPELARLWPSSPTSAWLRPLNYNDEFPPPVTRRENAVYQNGQLNKTTEVSMAQ